MSKTRIFLCFLTLIISAGISKAEEGALYIGRDSPEVRYEGRWDDSPINTRNNLLFLMPGPSSKGGIKIQLNKIQPGKYLLYYQYPSYAAKWISADFSLVHNRTHKVRSFNAVPALMPDNRADEENNCFYYLCGIIDINGKKDELVILSSGNDAKAVIFGGIKLEPVNIPPVPAGDFIRGINLSMKDLSGPDIDYVSGVFGPNAVRIRLGYDWYLDIRKNNQEALDRLFFVTARVMEKGALPIIVLDSVDGRILRTDNALFSSPALKNEFVSVWGKLAAHFLEKEQRAVFDLLNSPNPESLNDWYELAKAAVRGIRVVDRERRIIVQFPSADDVFDAPVPDTGVIYGLNYFYPESFTKQRIIKDDRAVVNYPGRIDGIPENAMTFVQRLAGIYEFLKKNPAPFIITEFSCVRWANAQDSYKYISDAVDMFEEMGLGWIYSEYSKPGSWDGFSPLHGTNKMDAAVVKGGTDRLRFLKSRYSAPPPLNKPVIPEME